MSPADTVVSRDACVLVVVDVQERLAAVMDARESVIERSRLLVSAAGIVGVPVIVTRQYPKGLGDTEPSLAETIGAVETQGALVYRADKVCFDCFAEPSFVDAVATTGRRQLLIVGMETHICVTQTALSGLRSGFDVHVAADAVCSRQVGNHEIALMRMAHAGAVVTTAESAAYELVGRAGTDEFKALLAVVKG